MPVSHTRCSSLKASTVTLGLSLLLASLCTRSPGNADDWPQFRGPNCSGNSIGTAALPLKFSATENVRWTQPVGDGIGSAVAAAGRVFVSGMTAPRQVTLAAFDAVSGKPLWKRQWNTGALPEVHQTNSHASSTPAADEHRVHFYFSTLGLLTLDATTGADLWKQELPVPFFVFKWGAGMSPVLCEDLVLFCQDDDLNPALYAFDRVTGKLRWKDDRSDMAVNYSHPIVNVVDGRSEIVVAGTGLLIGYDPQTGQAPLARPHAPAQHQDHSRLSRRCDLFVSTKRWDRQSMAGRRRSGRNRQPRWSHRPHGNSGLPWYHTSPRSLFQTHLRPW
ncbi:MAG UNVERIFIED_CONTAM: PQQ-like beta-propeller repeat protein [Planctomycetaceae bacterium]|jgi:hypothetical protein